MKNMKKALEQHLRPHLGGASLALSGSRIQALVDEANAISVSPSRLVLPTVLCQEEVMPPSVQARARESMCDKLLSGQIAVQFVLGGDARRLGKGFMYSLKLSGLAREHGFTQLRGPLASDLTLGQWQLQALARRAEALAGPRARENLTVVYQMSNAMESRILDELIEHDFFGLNRERALFITDPTPTPGFVLNSDGRLSRDSRSASRSYNHGYSTMLLAQPGAAFCLDSRGDRKTVPGPVIEWLRARRVELLVVNRVNDLTRLTDRVVDLDMLALSWHLMQERQANITFEVVDNPTAQTGGWAVRNLEVNPEGFGQIVDDHLNMATDALRIRLQELRGEARERTGRDLPYNAYRLIFKVDALREILREGLPMVAQHVDGRIYPSYGTSDITRTRAARALAIGESAESLHDFKQPSDLRRSLEYLSAEAEAGRVPLACSGSAVGRIVTELEVIASGPDGAGRLTGSVTPLDRSGRATAERLQFETTYHLPNSEEFRLLQEHRQTIVWALESSQARQVMPPVYARLLRGFQGYLADFDFANVFILRGAPARNPENGRPLLSGYASLGRLFLHERLLGTPGWLLHELLESWVSTGAAGNIQVADDGRSLIELVGADGRKTRLTPHKLIRGYGYRARDRQAPLTEEDEAIRSLGDTQGRGLQGWIHIERILIEGQVIALASETEFWTDGESLVASATFAGRAVVLVEPHPDDGMIGAGALFKALAENGIRPLSMISVVSDPEGVLDEYVYAHNHNIVEAEIDGHAADEFKRSFAPGQWRALKRAIRMGEAEDAAELMARSLGWGKDFVDLEIDLPLDEMVCFADGRLDSRFSRFRSPSRQDIERIRDLVAEQARRKPAAETVFLLPSLFDRHQHHQEVARMFLSAIAELAPEATIVFYEPLRGFEEQNIQPSIVYGFDEQAQGWYEMVIERAYRSQTWRHGYVKEIRRLAERRANVESSQRRARLGAFAQRFVTGRLVREAGHRG